MFDGRATQPYAEDAPTNPQNVYGRTKLEGEQLLAASGATALTCRTSWVFSMRGHNFLRTMLRLAREREVLRVVADQRGSPTWARWLAMTSTKLLSGLFRTPEDRREALNRMGGILHLTAAGETTWHGFAERILTLDPARSEQKTTRVEPIHTADCPTPANRPAYSVLSGETAEAAGIYRPRWEEQLEQALMT